MIDIKNIWNGWKNVIITDENIEAAAEVRLLICNGCDKKTSMITVDVCGLCHCPLIAKTRSKNERCPLGKW